jgi:hypothetical protein
MPASVHHGGIPGNSGDIVYLVDILLEGNRNLPCFSTFPIMKKGPAVSSAF